MPAVIAEPGARGAGRDRAAGRARCGRRCRIAGEDWTATEERGRLVYQDDDGLLDLPAPKLYGRHQFENAGTAIAALRVGGLKLPPAAFEAGMSAVEWPARMQRLSHGRAARAVLPPESELWLDGGHNAEGGRAIAAALADLEERVSRPLVLIVGMLSTKDAEGFLAQFRRAGAPRHRRADPSGQSACRRPHWPTSRAASASRRIARDDRRKRARPLGKLDLEPAPRVLITGSLYLAGEVLAANGTPPV